MSRVKTDTFLTTDNPSSPYPIDKFWSDNHRPLGWENLEDDELAVALKAANENYKDSQDQEESIQAGMDAVDELKDKKSRSSL